MMNNRRAIFLAGILLWLGTIGAAEAADPAMQDYTAYPMFITQAIQPNILIIMDNSGSMNFMAYGYHEDGAYHPDDFGGRVNGIAEGGGAGSLVDDQAAFTDKVLAGDILHNIDDSSQGTVAQVLDDHTLAISGTMSNGGSNGPGESYWVEHLALKNPTKVEDGYYGYFVPTARYTYGSNVFVRDDVAGEWSGTFLNWLTMRRVDVGRKVLMGGLATSRTGGGNQHLIGEAPAQSYRKFLKIVETPAGHTPYGNRHFYKIANGYIEVYKLDDDEPGLDYRRDFTTLSITSSGDDHDLADYNFDQVGNGAYEIRWKEPVVSGVADGMVDRNSDGTIDDRSSYRYYLYDPAQDFIDVVAPGDFFKNDYEGSTGYVTAVPQSVNELINALPSDILYDMFHDDMDGNDGYVVGHNPDVVYTPCQDDADFAECLADGDLNSALAPLIGHLVVFAVPLDPWGPNYGESYHFERTVQATQVAQFKIEVARDQTQPDEAADFVDGNIAGVLQKIGDRARFGLEFYNYSQGGDVVQYVGSGMTDLINRIENRGADTWTPLAESLYEGIRYFQQEAPYYYSGDYTRNNTWDPFYFNDLHRFVECSKSFVLQITDGESTMDLNIPEAYRDYDNDGMDYATYPSSGSDYLDDVALWAQTTDLRPGSDLPGTQNVTYYTVFAFGRGSTLLQDAARNGGFIDVNGDNIPEPSGGDPETIRLEWDRDEDGLPDTYFEAPSGFELESKIYQAITDILKRAASGTAVSVLSTSKRGEGTLYQAFFKPQLTEGTEDIKWLGYLQSLWVDEWGNMREETVEDGRLVLTEDKIIRFRFDEGTQQTLVDRYTDADGNGVIDNVDQEGNGIPDETVLLEHMRGIWEAGRLLALQTPDTRDIVTFADLNGDGVVEDGELVAFSEANLPTFGDFLAVEGQFAGSYAYLGDLDQRAGNLVRFVRGEQVSGLRNRRVTTDGALRVWKLGDIVTSTPTVVMPPAEAYEKIYGDLTYGAFASHWKDRQGMVYVGANDGMLHAFRTGRFVSGDDPSTVNKVEHAYLDGTDLGSEAWAYIPHNLLPHLKWLADPDYTHVFYADLKVKVADVKIFSPDADHPHGWGTLLVGGMRLGGGPYPVNVNGAQRELRSAYFLIDITNPDVPHFLAEFSHPQMGFTTSYPAIGKLGDSWYLIVGSGPTPGASAPYRYDGTSDQVARLFVLNLNDFMAARQIREGQELQIIQGVDNDAFMSDPITVDKPMDYSTDTVYVGETYWKSNRWNGRLYRLKTNGEANPANWQLSTLFQTAANQAITAAPTATLGFEDNIWVYFGTGRYYNDLDKADTNTQTLYGIQDAGSEVSVNDLLDVTSATVFTNQTVSGMPGVDTFSSLQSLSGSGWRMDLTDAGERTLSKAMILGGSVIFTSFIPDADICAMGGDGKLYALYFLTGTAHYEPIIGVEPNTNESLKSHYLGKGMPASAGMHVGSTDGATGFIQESTGNIIQIEVSPPLKFKSGRVFWQQLY